MEISEIQINPDNHKQYDLPYDELRYSMRDEILKKNNTVTDYFEDKLSNLGCQDFGGKYASFLEDIGIDFQTDNGWWSIHAVLDENIQAFIDYYSEDDNGDKINPEFVDEYNFAKSNYKYLKQNKKIKQFYIVTDMVYEINKHKQLIAGYQLNLL